MWQIMIFIYFYRITIPSQQSRKGDEPDWFSKLEILGLNGFQLKLFMLLVRFDSIYLSV